MAAVWLWVRGERRRRGRAVLVAAIVAVAAGAGMAALAGARRADSALERLGAATGEPNVVLVPVAEATGRGQIDVARAAESVDLVDEAMAIPGVEAVTHAANWAIAPDPEAGCPFGYGLVRSTASHPLGVAVAGRRSGAANEVMINETTAAQFGLRVGSELRLRTVRAEHLAAWLDGPCPPDDGPEILLRVTAFIRGVENVTDTAEPTFAVGPGFYARYAGEVAGCACTIWVRADADRVDDVRAALEALYGPYGFGVQPGEQVNTRAAETIGVEVDALRIAALVVAIAGALVVVQVLSRQAAAVAADHQVRRALGMTRPQMAAGSALATVPAIVTGGLVAVVGAALASSFLPRGLARRAEPDPGIRVDAAVLAGGFVVTVLFACAAAWTVGWMFALPARQRARRSVRGAIGPLPPPQVAFGVRMALDPAGDRGRATALSGVVGVALAVTGALAVGTVVASADHLRNTPELFGVSADLAVGTEDGGPGMADAAVVAALANSDVEAVARVLRLSRPDSYAGEGPSGASARVGPQAIRQERGVIGPTIQDGRLAATADEVVLGRATAAALAAELGDRVTVTRIDDRAVDYSVVGIAVSYGNDVVDQGFLLTERGIERLAVSCPTATPAAEDESDCADVEVEAVLARTAPRADRGAVAARLGEADMLPIPVPSIVDRFREMGPVPWYLVAMLAILGAFGLMHSSLVTGRRRALDLAVTRALGFTPRQAAAAVRWQGLATAAAGLVLGLAAGVLVGHLVWRNLADNIAVVIAVKLPPWAPLLASAGVIAVALAATAWPAARTRRTRPAEVLRTE
jgi:ABC-type lipoprotein release transport system permease subunit